MASARSTLTLEEVLAELTHHADPARKQRVARLGIPEENSLGVALPDVRRIAKRAGRSTALANELWATGLHEARLLAALVYVPSELTVADADKLVTDIVSWDLCDHLCNNLFLQMPGYPTLIDAWATAEPLYTRRAAFALIASAATHEKTLSDAQRDHYLAHIEAAAGDTRPHVKKAVDWALREIGQRDLVARDQALTLCDALIESGDKARASLGRAARREIERFQEQPGRRRLVAVR